MPDGHDAIASMPAARIPPLVSVCSPPVYNVLCLPRSFVKVSPMLVRTLSCLVLLLAVSPSLAAEAKRGLDVYFIDTEGGAATLIVTPARESILIDCGNPGSRDAERIHKVA